MKNFVGRWFLAAACLFAASGCSKVENNIGERAEINAVSTQFSLTVPEVPGEAPEPGIEPAQPIQIPLPPYPPLAGTSSGSDGSPNQFYIERTSLLSFAHLEEGKTYHQINTNELNIAFFSGDGNGKKIHIRRLKPTTPSPSGWTAHWNTLPNVENEHPEVLFMSEFRETFMIVLSKPCLEFGFELAPNRQDKEFTFRIAAGNFLRDASRGDITFPVKTPSGAQLFNIQAEMPFSVITILYDHSPIEDLNITHKGIAMANIRYRLAP
ncbi:hypothetical protein ACTHQF_11435 [Pedobacter sp. SAFR-022]|uniref:hypothetical protein n=1 Tax=Pedobacter sp. SAFR-022 TaxID=3436861 RepID=UPI003F7E7058